MLCDANIFSLLILVLPLVEPIFEAAFLRTDGWDKPTQSTDVQHSVSWMDEEYMLSFYGCLVFFISHLDFLPFQVLYQCTVWWAGPGQQPNSHPAASSLSLVGQRRKIGRSKKAGGSR